MPPPRDERAYMLDIIDCCGAIRAAVRGRTIEDYRHDRLFRSAMERELTVIGEAVRHILRLDPTREQALPEARAIIDFRNILVHGYHALNDELVWSILSVRIEDLEEKVRRMLPDEGRIG